MQCYGVTRNVLSDNSRLDTRLLWQLGDWIVQNKDHSTKSIEYNRASLYIYQKPRFASLCWNLFPVNYYCVSTSLEQTQFLEMFPVKSFAYFSGFAQSPAKHKPISHAAYQEDFQSITTYQLEHKFIYDTRKTRALVGWEAFDMTQFGSLFI